MKKNPNKNKIAKNQQIEIIVFLEVLKFLKYNFNALVNSKASFQFVYQSYNIIILANI